MEYDKNTCPVVDVDGVIAGGKQFDLDIRLPEDNRNVIYGVIKDCYGEPICDAVVKLIEVIFDCGKEERKPVSHTFTDKEGEFVFGPLCDKKYYEIQVWANAVKHCKICTDCKREGKCLKGVKLECKYDYKPDCKPDYKPDHKPDYKPECKPDCKPDYKPECKPECKPEHKPSYEDKYEIEYKEEFKEECKPDYKPDYKPECKPDCKPDYKPECKPQCRPQFRPMFR